MKNIQVIDGAMNSAYSIYQVTDEGFAMIFPGPGQDIEFIDDLIARIGGEATSSILVPAWDREINKPDANGIHGTLFYELEFKKPFYPNKKESDIAQNLYRPNKDEP